MFDAVGLYTKWMWGGLGKRRWSMNKTNNKKNSCRQIRDYYYIVWLLQLG
jgi:ribosomal protein L16 Arg81 hydroxylase